MLERLYPLGLTMTVVEDAIIVAAGLGSRMLPTSAYLPKESIPLVDIPAFIHLVREAAEAGVKRIHVITSRSKNFGNFFQDKSNLKKLKPEISPELFDPGNGMEISYHIQSDPLGLGHAILQSLESIQGPFLVLLGDNILCTDFSGIKDFKPSIASKRLVSNFVKTNLPCAGIFSVPENEISNYGVVKLDDGKIVQIVEKPDTKDAPSDKVLCGRYIFTQDAKDLLENKFTVETHGELQSIAIQKYWMEGVGLVGVDLSDHQWYDSGKPLSWLKSQIDYGLRNPDYSLELSRWLKSRLSK